MSALDAPCVQPDMYGAGECPASPLPSVPPAETVPPVDGATPWLVDTGTQAGAVGFMAVGVILIAVALLFVGKSLRAHEPVHAILLVFGSVACIAVGIVALVSGIVGLSQGPG